MLVDGKWTKDWQPVQADDGKGGFVRQTSSFRNWITSDGRAGPTGDAGFKAETGRYRLYVALICPWASRTLVARKLKGLTDLISVTVVEPQLTTEGWRFGTFPGADTDPLFGATHIHEIYTRADPHFTGRATVPVLWDMKQNVMVNNESADILRMFNTAFSELVPETVDLYPSDLSQEIDALNATLYEKYNNGVYRAGFATSQTAHDEAVVGVFEALDALEVRLGDGRQFIFGDRLTETDVRVFVTSIRFDAAYHGLFKANLKQLRDYPFVHAHMERVLNLPDVVDTVSLEHIKAGYYSVGDLNPNGIVPNGPTEIIEMIARAEKLG